MQVIKSLVIKSIVKRYRRPARVAIAGVAVGAFLSLAAPAPLAAQENLRRGLDLGLSRLNHGLQGPLTAGDAAASDESRDSANPAAAGGDQGQAAGGGPMSFFEGTELFGLVDGYYDWYSTKPSGDAPLRNFDTKHNQFGLSLLEFGLAKAPTADSRAGFRLDLDYGPTTALVHGAEPGGVTIFQNIQQAYMSYLAPAGNGLQFDVGKFVTQHGAEVIEAKDNWNYSRSILFAWAIPYYHMGVRASYAASDKVTIAGALVNGWNNVVENNEAKTFGAQLILKPTASVTLTQNYMGGPEQADNDDDWRHLSDTTIMYTATDALSLMVNYDYGRDTVAGESVQYQGIGAYAKYVANDRFALIPRVEWYQDDDGFTTGTAQTLKEFTLTGEVTLAPRLLWRIEYRGDFSDVDFFENHDGTFRDNQHSIGFGVLYSFSSKTP